MDVINVPKHPLKGKLLNNYVTSEDGDVTVLAFVSIGPSFEEIISGLKNYRWRNEDFLLATYPKNGTHFMWEVMMMLVKGSAENVADVKQAFMIDMFPVSKIDALFPSPRVLNTHYRLDVLPAEFRDRKTVVVMRNPKDTCVSYYHHEIKAMAKLGDGEVAIQDTMSLSDFIKMFLYNKDVPYGSYFDYIEYMWSLRNNPNILIVFFEDLKLDPVSTIQKVNEFMGTDRSPDLVQQIAMATSFNKMKDAKTNSKLEDELQAMVKFSAENTKVAFSYFYRKGEVGDWKRHLTVADNELFDSFLQNWKVGQEIPFKYV